jgi:uncharacterized phage protein (TIGR01671 family)
MREIKFRAWRKDEGYMVTSARGVYTALQHIMGLASQPHFSNIDNQPRPEKYIVMQYTGLKDKNGIEIFEGDVLQMYDYPPFVMEWVCGHNNVGWTHFSPQHIVEVIGNIYENPELLEVCQ